jgi:uncharacterized protein
MPFLADAGAQSSTSCDARLRELLRGWRRVAIAVSGGVDSVLLSAVAVDELGARNVLLLNARSPAFPPEEAEFVAAFADSLGVRLEIVDTEELDVEEYAENPPTRCYFCRTEMYGRLGPIALDHGFEIVLDGANEDDRGDFRPGMKAADENGVLHPLMASGFGKKEIRELARAMDLPVWDKPAFSCLASRFPYGERIDAAKLSRVQRAEAAVRDLGFRIFRVRSHDNLARVEVGVDEIERAIACRADMVSRLRDVGYDFVTLDLEGFRSGSMNEPLLKRLESVNAGS